MFIKMVPRLVLDKDVKSTNFLSALIIKFSNPVLPLFARLFGTYLGWRVHSIKSITHQFHVWTLGLERFSQFSLPLIGVVRFV